MRRRLLDRIARGNPLASLPSTMQTVVSDGASQSGKIVKAFLHGRQIPRRTQKARR